jgi:hypothetical protein
MNALQEEIRRFVGQNRILVVPRNEMPFENEFSKWDGLTDFYAFDEEKCGKRVKKLSELPEMSDIWGAFSSKDMEVFGKDLCCPRGWADGYADDKRWSQETEALGRQIFGDWFNDYPQGQGRCGRAVIAQSSSCLTVWDQTESGLKIVLKHSNGGSCSIWHEAAHLRFCYPPSEDPNIGYFGEALADGVMAYMLLLNKTESNKQKAFEHAAEVQERIYARRLQSFFDISATSHWTAAAIEATLQKERIPNEDEYFFTMRGLQTRVLYTLLANETGIVSRTTYSTNERENVIGEKMDAREKRCIIEGFDISFMSFTPEKVIGALIQVMDTHELAEATRTEGEKIVEAYNYFCPDKAVPYTPITPAAKNKIPALAAA